MEDASPVLAPAAHGFGPWLRNRNQREGAVLYYLSAIVGYTPDEISHTVFALEAYQVEELALLGIAHRREHPGAWASLTRK